jgi:hypothetical protein
MLKRNRLKAPGFLHITTTGAFSQLGRIQLSITNSGRLEAGRPARLGGLSYAAQSGGEMLPALVVIFPVLGRLSL